MIKKLSNFWLKRKTDNLTKIHLFFMMFNWRKFQKDGKDRSCLLYALYPDIAKDEFLRKKLQECVDYIRDNYDMEIFTKI